MPDTHPTSLTADPGARPGRIDALDIVRGFALCGILLVNVPPLIDLAAFDGNGVNSVRVALDLFVQQRFFPIFSLLFGVGFGLMWLTAARRSPHPRLALLRRLAVLLVLGFLHELVHPGEALLPYAIVGIVFLLPATWLRGRAAVIVPLVLGTVLLVLAATQGGSILLIPGLFLLGFTAGRSGRTARIAAAVPGQAVVAGVAWAASLALLLSMDLQMLQDQLAPGLGLLLATAYVATLLLLLHTPLARLLKAVFAPLGRMALTNYLSATLIVLALRPAMPALGVTGADDASWLRMLAVCVAILAVQNLVSTLWLRHFRQGPLEAAWRWATWGRPAPVASDTTSTKAGHVSV